MRHWRALLLAHHWHYVIIETAFATGCTSWDVQGSGFGFWYALDLEELK
jgi:hypothetical protein